MPASQLNPVLRDLEKLKSVFDLTRDELGVKAHEMAVEVMYRLMGEECDPDGSPWPELSGPYAEWKARTVGARPISELWQIMRTREQLFGRDWVSPTEARFTYGVDPEAIDEAEWFSEGNDRQPPRPFYAFGTEALTRLDQFFDAIFDRAAR